MSSVQGGTHSFSAGTRQKFMPEYLAKQLPMFQERIPRPSQVRMRERGEQDRVRVSVCILVPYTLDLDAVCLCSGSK